MSPRWSPRRLPQPPSRASSRERHTRGVEQIQTPAIHLNAHARPHAHVGKSGQARDQGLATGIQMYQRFAPERLDDQHVAVADALVDRPEAHNLRTMPALKPPPLVGHLDGNTQPSALNARPPPPR